MQYSNKFKGNNSSLNKIFFLALTLTCTLLLLGFVFSNAIESFTINSNTGYSNDANVLLNISLEDGNEMQFSCDPDVSWSALEDYATTKYFDLNSWLYGCSASSGERMVYLKVEYTDGNTSSGDHNASITLDFINPTVTSFSPSGEIIAGDGDDGQAISIVLADDVNLDYVSVSLNRNETSVYDSNETACSVTGTDATCLFTDYSVDRGASYSYSFTVYDKAGNSVSDTTSFQFTDSVVPSKPSTLGGVVSDTNINLSWTENSERDVNSYKIYYSTQSGFTCDTSTLITTLDTNSYLHTSLDENTTYYYKIKAIDLTGNQSLCSDQNYFVTDYDLANGPTITRTNVSCDSNEWCHLDEAIFSFLEENSKYSWILTTSSSTTPSDCNYYASDCNTGSTILISDIANGTSYFKVKACKPTGCSNVSTFIIKTDDVSPSQPIPSAIRLSYDVNLSWTASTDTGGSALDKYYIYRSTQDNFNPSSSTLLTTVDDVNLFYFDGSPTKGLTYYYKVLARDNAGNYSSDVNAKIITVTIPLKDEETEIIIEFFNSNKRKTRYFNSADDFNLSITFSKPVNDFNLLMTIDDEDTETIIVSEDDISNYSHLFVTSSNYEDINFFITYITDDLNSQTREYHLYYDNTKPTISFSNIVDGEEFLSTKIIEIEASDNKEVYSVELFLNGESIGFADKNSENWLYTFNPEERESGVLKAVAKDGVNLSAFVERNIVSNYVAGLNGEITKEEIVAKLNELIQKQELINEKYLKGEIVLTSQALEAKNYADELILEAEGLLESDLVKANENVTKAAEIYEKLLEDLNKDTVFMGVFEIIPAIIIVLTIVLILVVIGIIIKKKKGSSSNPSLAIDKDVEL